MHTSAAAADPVALAIEISGNCRSKEQKSSVYNEAGPLADKLAHEHFFHERFGPDARLMTDALRHLIGSAMTTRDRGENTAGAGGGLQEFVDALLGGDDRDRKMDEFNNELGRKLYGELNNALGRAPTNAEIGDFMVNEGIYKKRAIFDYRDHRIPQRLNGGRV